MVLGVPTMLCSCVNTNINPCSLYCSRAVVHTQQKTVFSHTSLSCCSYTTTCTLYLTTTGSYWCVSIVLVPKECCRNGIQQHLYVRFPGASSQLLTMAMVCFFLLLMVVFCPVHIRGPSLCREFSGAWQMHSARHPMTTSDH